MDEETAKYIINYYFKLLPDKEKIAWKHYSSISKLDNNKNPEMLKLYMKRGWLSEDKSVLDLLKDGYEKFEINSAKKILLEKRNEVFLNNCTNCGKLARTPYAKQCRYCNYNWH